MSVEKETPAPGGHPGGRKTEWLGGTFSKLDTTNHPQSQDILRDGFDNLRIDFLAECADLLTARSVALRMAALDGDLRTYDAIFASVRLIASEMVRTRRETKTPPVNQTGGAL